MDSFRAHMLSDEKGFDGFTLNLPQVVAIEIRYHHSLNYHHCECGSFVVEPQTSLIY